MAVPADLHIPLPFNMTLIEIITRPYVRQTGDEPVSPPRVILMFQHNGPFGPVILWAELLQTHVIPLSPPSGPTSSRGSWPGP